MKHTSIPILLVPSMSPKRALPGVESSSGPTTHTLMPSFPI